MFDVVGPFFQLGLFPFEFEGNLIEILKKIMCDSFHHPYSSKYIFIYFSL